MITLVPDHVLEQKNWVIVVAVHVAASLQPALNGIPHRMRTVVQQLCDAARVALVYPLFFGQVFSELGSSSETNTSRT